MKQLCNSYANAIKRIRATQLNYDIGGDWNLIAVVEFLQEKVLELIAELEKFTKVVQKKNLGRLLK
jgi:hypothetical protein